MWYLSSALKPVGPFQLIEIQDKIKKGQIGPRDLIFNETAQEWKAAQEWDEIRHLGFPAFEAVKTDKPQDPIWIVLHKNADQSYRQEGPFKGDEIVNAVQKGDLGWDDLVWKKGLSGWARLSDRQEFSSPEI